MPFAKGHEINRLKITGQKFGRLRVIKYTRIKNHNTMWLCKCSCGKTKEIAGSSLIDGNTKSCGCLGTEKRRKATFKHGMRDDKFYKNWCAMRYRCKKSGKKLTEFWGDKGIKVCERWQNFMNYKKDMYKSYIKHIKVHGHIQTTIERVDNNKDYCKENCKWATRFEQNSNTNRNVFIEFNGQRLTMSEWARKLNLDRSTILYRVYKAKWPLKKALTK